MTVAGDPSPTARHDLMAACRALMRNLLLSQEVGGSEWIKRLTVAVRHVEEAARCGRRVGEPAGEADVGRLGGGLAKLYLDNLLSQEEKVYATESARSVESAEPERAGFHGFSWAISIADVLSFLQMQGASGLLRVNTGDEVISLVLEQGDLTNALATTRRRASDWVRSWSSAATSTSRGSRPSSGDSRPARTGSATRSRRKGWSARRASRARSSTRSG